MQPLLPCVTAAVLLAWATLSHGVERTDEEPNASDEQASEAEATTERRSRRRGRGRRPEPRDQAGDESARPTVPRVYSPIRRPEVNAQPVPVPDRWRIVDALGQQERRLDPYNQNTIKGDKPVHGDWFFSLAATYDLVGERRRTPLPVGLQSTRSAGALDTFGDAEQEFLSHNVAAELVYYKGDTVFRPPDYEFRLTPVFNVNRTALQEILATNADPAQGRIRDDDHVGIQAAFFDKHLRDVSAHYDFDSIRVGIQPFTSDFRGFLFQDSPLGLRLFGTRRNNRLQYNLAVFRRLEKDTNSGLNDIGARLRKDDVFVANVYLQDRPRLGFFSQFTVVWNRNRDTDVFYDRNAFIARPASIGQERPRQYDVLYLGFNGDGHFGRLNLTTALYVALGEQQDCVFAASDCEIQAYFAAAEPSLDFDWIRLRLSLLYASGDSDPFDGVSEGFDAIFENPLFAGADTSYWIRQNVPLVGGGRVALSQRNGLLNSMRSSKEHGQSNFDNPGLGLAGVGVDLDLLPSLRLSLNANYLAFAAAEPIAHARGQANVDAEIGIDLSVSAIWRPFMSQNIVLRLSYATLRPGRGFEDLYQDQPYSLLANLLLTF